MKMRIAGFIILAIGVILTALLFNSLVRDVPVWIFGRRVSATIEEKWWEDLDLENLNRDDLNLEYFFSYRFTTSDGESILGISKVTEDEFMSFLPGSEVKIKYSRLNPEDNRLDDSRFVPFLLCSYIPFILICWFALAAGREMIDN